MWSGPVEKREFREIQHYRCDIATFRGESYLGWSRLVSAGLVPIAIGTARPQPLDHRDRFTFERLLASVERRALTDKKEGLTSWKKLVMSGSNQNGST